MCKKRLVPMKLPLVLCFRRFLSKKKLVWNQSREHFTVVAFMRRKFCGQIKKTGRVAKWSQ